MSVKYTQRRIPKGAAKAAFAHLAGASSTTTSATFPGLAVTRSHYDLVWELGGVQSIQATPQVTSEEVPAKDATIFTDETLNNLTGTLVLNAWEPEALRVFLGADVLVDTAAGTVIINQYKGAVKKEFGLWIVRNATRNSANSAEKELAFLPRVTAGQVPRGWENSLSESLAIPITILPAERWLDNINPDGRFPITRTTDNLFEQRVFGTGLDLPTNADNATAPAVSSIQYYNGSSWTDLDAATGVTANSVIRITFSKAVKGAEDPKNYTLVNDEATPENFAFALNYDPITLICELTPIGQVADAYDLTVGTGISDAQDRALSAAGTAGYTVS